MSIFVVFILYQYPFSNLSFAAMKPPELPLKHPVLLMVLLCLVFTSCRHYTTQVIPAFYYWKNNSYDLHDSERSYVIRNGVKKLYVKLFEVAPDPLLKNIPVAKISLSISNWDTVARTTERIPVVFVRNDVLLKITEHELDTLAGNIVSLVGKYAARISVGTSKDMTYPDRQLLKELQIDCDWTARTKDNYFYLLKAIKKRIKADISCTLRLYPYKYPEKMGIPPVDKVMLMCYNLISPVGNDHKNSILDNGELKAYLQAKKRYPLHLDIALPLYSWMQYYKHNRLAGIIYHDHQRIQKSLKKTDPLWFEVTSDVVIDDYYLRPGDRIKYEVITANQLRESIEIIKDKVPLDKTTTIAFFHLDANQLQQYSHATLDSFYNSFSR